MSSVGQGQKGRTMGDESGGRRSHAVVGDPLLRTKRGKVTTGREVWRAGQWPSCGGDDLLLKNTV